MLMMLDLSLILFLILNHKNRIRVRGVPMAGGLSNINLRAEYGPL